MDLLDDVLPVDDERPVARHPQGDVKDGAVLGRVDVLAAEHRLTALGEPGLRREGGEQGDRLVGDPVLRVVEVEAHGLGGQALPPVRIGGEQVAEVHARDLGVVALERLEAVAVA